LRSFRHVGSMSLRLEVGVVRGEYNRREHQRARGFVEHLEGVFGVLHRVVEPVNHAQGVRQPVSVRVSRAGREGGRLERRRAVSAHFVGRY
jgi:hypothetical protein